MDVYCMHLAIALWISLFLIEKFGNVQHLDENFMVTSINIFSSRKRSIRVRGLRNRNRGFT
ncbi:hypothetical protein CCP3SC5AM1_860008 [Gammaproteobacteria bacterium]